MAQLTTSPLATIGPTEAVRDKPSAARAECPVCTKTFVASAIVVDDVRPLPFNGGLIIPTGRCRLYCDHCDHIIQWRAEVIDEQPTRNVFGVHHVIHDGRTIRAFLIKHPQAAGVEQR